MDLCDSCRPSTVDRKGAEYLKHLASWEVKLALHGAKRGKIKMRQERLDRLQTIKIPTAAAKLRKTLSELRDLYSEAVVLSEGLAAGIAEQKERDLEKEARDLDKFVVIQALGGLRSGAGFKRKLEDMSPGVDEVRPSDNDTITRSIVSD